MNYVFNQFCNPYDKQNLEIKIKVSNQVKNVVLIYGDPHDYVEDKNHNWIWQKKEKNMELENISIYNKYFSLIISEKKSRFRYYFKIELAEDNFYFYGQSGIFHDDESKDFDIFSSFFFPYIHENEYFKTSKWVKDQVWIQIFVDRFSNGDKTNDPDRTLVWGEGELSGSTFYGGDLRGIINKLPYLKDLGYTGIYLTPIFLADSSHKYDTLDYLKIDPAFGTKEDLKELVDKAHEHGFKIMLDAVLNHSSNNNEIFKDIVEKKDKSEFLDYYHINSLDPLSYETFSNVLTMPKWNTTNKKVQEYLLYVLNYYIEEFNIDAWRFDVANELDHTFVRMINKSIKSKYPDFYLMAEIWHDPKDWISYDQFDANMEYEISSIFVKYLKSIITADDAVARLSEIQYRTPTNQLNSQFHMIDSHDTKRVFNMLDKDEDKALMALFILALQKGSVCFYYGDEYLMEGENDPYCRRCLPLKVSAHENNIKDKFKKIIEFRKNHLDIIQNSKAKYFVNNNLLTIEYEGLSVQIDPSNKKIFVDGKVYKFS